MKCEVEECPNEPCHGQMDLCGDCARERAIMWAQSFALGTTSMLETSLREIDPLFDTGSLSDKDADRIKGAISKGTEAVREILKAFSDVRLMTDEEAQEEADAREAQEAGAEG